MRKKPFKLCSEFQELNVTGSAGVTDKGLEALLVSDDSKSTSLCESLKFVKMRSTGVRVAGVRILFARAKNLLGVRCSSLDVLQALAIHLKGTLSSTLKLFFPIDKRKISHCPF